MVKLFSHTDLDGIGCGILAKLAFGKDVDISYCDYDNIDSSFIKNVNIILYIIKIFRKQSVN